ncbi:hypothetical protein CPB84DRAFT_1962762 [Gymnopilus junonius]|uniref:HMG box domain-containing protein n=1 Tax=Gymnopilus junonius TaxID=109634 RepID=A0A9P5NLR7_GYMJU|nr:hypothetical protein CPB84DRAFT_1962762 [Gymnopilus junonius]
MPSTLPSPKEPPAPFKEVPYNLRYAYLLPFASHIIEFISLDPASSPRPVTRPPNCFMIFRAAFVKAGLGDLYPNLTLSGAAGRAWKSLPEDEKQKWIDTANEIKAAHVENYPNIIYPPRRTKKHLHAHAHARALDRNDPYSQSQHVFELPLHGSSKAQFPKSGAPSPLSFQPRAPLSLKSHLIGANTSRSVYAYNPTLHYPPLPRPINFPVPPPVPPPVPTPSKSTHIQRASLRFAPPSPRSNLHPPHPHTQTTTTTTASSPGPSTSPQKTHPVKLHPSLNFGYLLPFTSTGDIAIASASASASGCRGREGGGLDIPEAGYLAEDADRESSIIGRLREQEEVGQIENASYTPVPDYDDDDDGAQFQTDAGLSDDATGAIRQTGSRTLTF